jgi:alpha-methylacyl-CoA racemase
MLPLDGVRVLDLSRLLPGPYATLVMAELGAQVDKIEDPEGGDYLRQMPPLTDEGSALFLALNKNKRSATLDLKSEAGKAALLKLLPRYDILVESFRPGVMARLGLGYETLAAVHPGLIYCAITGYGQTGPDALRAGHDLNYLARAGLLGLCGPANAPPPLPGGQVADIGGSLFSLVGILAALHQRHSTGKGQLLDVSMTEGATAFLHLQLGGRLEQGRATPPVARGADVLNGGYASYQVYRARDGKSLAVGALEPKFFSKLCARLGRPDLVEAGYDLAGGGAARATVELAEIFATRTRDEWVALLAKDDVCVEPVLEGDEVFNDPQHLARGLFSGGQLRNPVPLPHATPRRAPGLGEQTREILREAGFSEEALQPFVVSRR